MHWLRRLLGLVLLVGVLVGGWKFAADNAAEVTISYVAGELTAVALWQALLAAFGVGAAVAGVFALYSITRLRLIARRYRKTVQGLEAEVHQLRSLPLAPDGAGASALPEATVELPREALERGA